ncbi:tRNA (guanine-N(1)-)-methyltransferase-like [Rattus rattus]|uniref:tRNA (guanine-N(1)-)-methyltransferase-like n=1 Tax=Rattus rattus TaxID=10117 RepID=UPI0013F367C3|nr:tRNA (guanine-N(1)-)-methyltransferase-like [Rattus rattus]
MKFTILTAFPDSFTSYFSSSIIKQAQNKNLVNIELINFRREKGHKIDDYAYGGKTGMVLKIEPIVECLKTNNLLNHSIILLSPSGKPLTQQMARDLAKQEHIVMLCGHYEGIDARIQKYVTHEVSIGDYLLTSGELAAMVILDCVTRLIPGVINQQSLETESFDEYLLDYPVYTRPPSFEGQDVPEIYLSGNHGEIEKFRKQEQERITKERRPDLWKKYLKYKETNTKTE